MNPPESIVLAVDAVSVDIILALSEHPIFFPDADRLAAFVDYISSAIPRRRACQEAAMGTGESGIPRDDIEGGDWEVEVSSVELGEAEFTERLAYAAGWSFRKARRAIEAGSPIIIGTKLTLAGALEIQNTAARHRIGTDLSINSDA